MVTWFLADAIYSVLWVHGTIHPTAWLATGVLVVSIVLVAAVWRKFPPRRPGRR
jgi:hypothetical protein